MSDELRPAEHQWTATSDAGQHLADAPRYEELHYQVNHGDGEGKGVALETWGEREHDPSARLAECACRSLLHVCAHALTDTVVGIN